MSENEVVRIVLWELKPPGLSCGGFGQPTEFGYISSREYKTQRTRRYPLGARLVLELPSDAPVEYDEPGRDEGEGSP